MKTKLTWMDLLRISLLLVLPIHVASTTKIFAHVEPSTLQYVGPFLPEDIKVELKESHQILEEGSSFKSYVKGFLSQHVIKVSHPDGASFFCYNRPTLFATDAMAELKKQLEANGKTYVHILMSSQENDQCKNFAKKSLIFENQ